MKEHELFAVWFLRVTSLGLAAATWMLASRGNPAAVFTGIGTFISFGVAFAIAEDASKRMADGSPTPAHRAEETNG